jgi:hypothetical protein
VDLRPARDPGLHLESAALPRRVALDLVRERRARPDQAHVAAHDVPELRELVEREAPQDSAGPRDPRIAFVDREARAAALRADLHRPQLQELELGSADPDAPLPVEDRAAVVELDRQCGEREHGARQRQPERGAGDVQRAVQRVPSAFSQTGGTPARR